jgi:hypothetical protein
VRVPSSGRASSSTSSGASSVSVNLRRVSSTFRRMPSYARRRASSNVFPETVIQGREFVKALFTRTRNTPGDRQDMLDGPGAKSPEKISAFCDQLTGFNDEKFIKKNQELLALLPDDRSFADLRVLLDLVDRLPFFNACSAVEKFSIVRSGRLMRCSAGQTGPPRRDSACVRSI